MLKAVKLGKELVVTTDNKVGVLAAISKILADHGLNIEGVAGYAQDKMARLMLVVDDTLRAKDAIIKAGYKDTKENEVVVADLQNKPGALKSVAAKLASDNIDIRYMYGTACPTGCPARIIFATAQNEKAVVSLKSK